MSNEEKIPGILETLKAVPLHITVLGLAFWVFVGWWSWSQWTYRDVPIEDRQYCYALGYVGEQAAYARDDLIPQRRFASKLRQDTELSQSRQVGWAIELAYSNTLMEPSELREHVEGKCLRLFRHSPEEAERLKAMSNARPLWMSRSHL